MGKARQKIDPLFDYRGDNARNASGGSARTYSADYSPNNIRSVVISPNGVLVRYHIGTAGTKNRSYCFAEFNERDLYSEEQDPKYKPILRMLAVPLVCGSLEEIVVLGNSLSGQVHPNYLAEIQLDGMVASFKGAGADLKSRISNRFTRLRYYTVVSCNWKEFMNYFSQLIQTKEVTKYHFFSEMPGFASRAQITEVGDADYWKSWNALPSTYAFDAKLKAHFEDVKKRREAADKMAAVDEQRNKRVGSKIQAINDLIEEYLTYNKLWSAYYSIVQKEGTNGVLPDLSFVRPPENLQLLPFKGMAKVPDTMISKQPCSEAEAFEKDEELLSKYKARCSKALVGNFLMAISKLSGEPYLLKTLMKNCETTVCVPPDLASVASQLQGLTGVAFNGRDLEASIINSCWQFMQCFVGCAHTEPFTRKYWESKLSRRGTRS